MLLCHDCETPTEHPTGDRCDECATVAGLMFTDCARCGWFGIPIAPDGCADYLCVVCDWMTGGEW